jgi:hypothetical protein
VIRSWAYRGPAVNSFRLASGDARRGQLVGELEPPLQRRGSSTAVDGLTCGPEGVAEGVTEILTTSSVGDERTCRVGEDGVSGGALLPAEDPVYGTGIVGGVAAA